MNDFQRGEAIEVLIAQTEVDEEKIEEYSNFELEAWLQELGYEWDTEGGYGMGAWVNVNEART